MVAASMFTAPIAEAAFGRSSSSSRSSISSRSAAPAAKPSVSQKSSPTVSGGQSIGMSRSQVTQSVRDGSYKKPAPSVNQASNGGYNSYPQQNHYNPPQVAQPPRPGFGVGALAGAAVLGGVAGYMMNQDSHGKTYYTRPDNPGVMYDESGKVTGSNNNGVIAPVMAGSSTGSNSSGGFGFGSFLFLVLLGGVAYFIYRKMKQDDTNGVNYMQTTNSSFSLGSTKDKILDMKDDFFVKFQENNRPSQISFIQENSDVLFFNEVKDIVNGADELRLVKVIRLESELVDLTKEGSTEIASVHYNADIEEEGSVTNVNEVWHFKYLNNKWKLAGIEQV